MRSNRSERVMLLIAPMPPHSSSNSTSVFAGLESPLAEAPTAVPGAQFFLQAGCKLENRDVTSPAGVLQLRAGEPAPVDPLTRILNRWSQTGWHWPSRKPYCALIRGESQLECAAGKTSSIKRPSTLIKLEAR